MSEDVASGALVEPGRQVERTALSRQRTAVGVATNGALMLHLGAQRGGLGLVLGAAALAMAAVLWAGSTGVRLPGRPRARGLAVRALRPATTAAVVVTVSLVDVILVLVS